jgi:glycosyltransferase involved in cell wall biosynthesis
LFAAIEGLPGKPITPVIITGARSGDAAAHFPGVEVLRTALLDRKSTAWFVRKILETAGPADILLRRFLQGHGIRVLSHSSHLGRQSTVKTIGWIPDFQHVHLPDLFTAKQLEDRNQQFSRICRFCDKVIVSSECARADLEAFAPEQAGKAALLRFVASPVPLADAAGLPEFRSLYDFEGPYFLLPNQFWAHKNHRVVIAALQLLKQRKQRVLVLCTGSTKDHRNPAYFGSLMEYAEQCGVLESFRVLGQIPFEHLAGLMQHAIAFLNPSRFEGWSTSVEEAKSMGKQIVLSDIPVHREQAPARSFFFPAEDIEALAEALIAAAAGFDAEDDAAQQAEARARFPERLRQFGEDYARIVASVL